MKQLAASVVYVLPDLDLYREVPDSQTCLDAGSGALQRAAVTKA